jgi:CDP-glycerol glycerophosphotransferase
MNPEKAMLLEAGYSGADIVASTSPWVTRELFSRAFRAKSFMEDGYPRNDVLLRQLEKHDLLGADAGFYRRLLRHRKSGGKVVVYMPTFRDTGLDFIAENGGFALDPPAMARYAEAGDTLFVLKLHPYVNDASLSKLPGVLRYPSQDDIYPILSLADALITDYSSVYFDFLLLDRPVLFFPYDRGRYLSRDREFFFSYEDMTPGPVATVQAELLEYLSAALRPGGDAWGKRRRALRDLLFAHRDGGSAERICRRIQAALRNMEDAAA